MIAKVEVFNFQGVPKIGAYPSEHWSATQRQSRKGSVEEICAKNLLKGHTGETDNLEICTDSLSAAMSKRLVPGGRVQHLEVQTVRAHKNQAKNMKQT